MRKFFNALGGFFGGTSLPGLAFGAFMLFGLATPPGWIALIGASVVVGAAIGIKKGIENKSVVSGFLWGMAGSLLPAVIVGGTLVTFALAGFMKSSTPVEGFFRMIKSIITHRTIDRAVDSMLPSGSNSPQHTRTYSTGETSRSTSGSPTHALARAGMAPDHNHNPSPSGEPSLATAQAQTAKAQIVPSSQRASQTTGTMYPSVTDSQPVSKKPAHSFSTFVSRLRA